MLYTHLPLLTSSLKMEAACSSKTLIATYSTTGCQNPEHHSLNSYIIKQLYRFYSVAAKYESICGFRRDIFHTLLMSYLQTLIV
jgi:hypothetical protein